MTEINKNNQANSPKLTTAKNEEKCYSFKKTFSKIKSSFKSCFASKSAIAIIFAIMGVFGTVLAQGSSQDNNNYYFDDFDKMVSDHHKRMFENNSFLNNNDILKEMELMNKKMSEVIEKQQKEIEKALKKADKNGSAVRTSVSSKEDDDNYYYELNFSGLKKEEIAVEVKDNILNFSAQQIDESKNKNQKSYTSSDFYYSFSVPQYDSKKNPAIVRLDNKISVTLPKINKKTKNNTKI